MRGSESDRTGDVYRQRGKVAGAERRWGSERASDTDALSQGRNHLDFWPFITLIWAGRVERTLAG